jgi:signal transduction histidine kinase
MLNQYLLIVWVLHTWRPGVDPQRTHRQILWFEQALAYGSIYMPVALYHFTLRFADVRWKVWRWLDALGWLCATAFAVTDVFGWFVMKCRWTGHTWIPDMSAPGSLEELAYTAFFYFTSFYVTLGLLVPLTRAFTHPDRQRRLQLFYFLLGATPLWLSCWANFLISCGLRIYPPGGLAFLLHAGIISYAVLRRKVFDFTVVVRRGFAYACVSLALGMLYGLLVLLAPYSGLPQVFGTGTLPAIAFVLIAGLAFAPLLNHLEKSVDRLFFRATAQRQSALEQFARETASTVQLDFVAQALCRLLDKCFQPRHISFYLADGTGRLVLYAFYQDGFTLGQWPAGEPIPGSIQAQMTVGRSAQHLPLPKAPAGQRVLELAEGDEALVLPILHGEERLGCVILEARRADDPYSDADAQFAETIAAHSSSVLVKARAFAQIERLQELTTRTLEGLTTGVLVVTSGGRLVQANSAARALCLPEPQSPPETLDELAKLQPLVASVISRFMADHKPITNEEVRLDTPRHRSVLLSLRQIEAKDAGHLLLVILNDITDVRELEKVVRQKESLARVGEAISAVNHEIKNVVQPIQYQINKLVELEHLEENTARRPVTVLADRVAGLQRLLANLRDLSRPIELRPGRIDLADLVDSVWRDLRDTPAAAQVEFKTNIAGAAQHCRADGHWLRQVLYNIIRNAVEATSGNAHPRVNVSTALLDSELTISIRDNGCGMDESSCKRLFELFFSTKGEAGTGLGLSISRKVIELHGGRIQVQSKLGEGTTFEVTLPVREPSADVDFPVATSTSGT